MRVLHLVAPAPFGGLEQVVYALSVGQKRKGDDVGVITLLERDARPPSLVGELRRGAVTVISVIHSPRSYRAQRRSILATCDQLAPDVLHSHGYLPDVLAASLGSRFPAARVSTVHGFTRGSLRNRLYERMQRRSFSCFDAVVAVSHVLARELASTVSSGLIQTLPNAWTAVEEPVLPETARATLQLSANVFNVGWIGRMSREKGADILVEALPGLDDLKIHVTFIGEGDERPKLEGRAKELQVEARVSWRGEEPQAGRLLRAFDLLVISSRTEGTPITLFEAMHAGTPIVATSVGGVPDVVSSEEAELIQPENPVALASAIRRVHDMPDEARVRAIRARSRLQSEFAAAPWIDGYSRIYEMAIAARTYR
ncbi:MAG: glycosyltransferase family 4 protein [Gemmatimonadota bacterium]|nr:glycosyltransferase family 4 protein [Gemmatimonadota bacterium]